MSDDSPMDDWTNLETAQRRLSDGEFGDGEAAIAITELINSVEHLRAENKRLSQISDQIGSDLQLDENTDALTGVFKRAPLLKLTEGELERAERFDRPLSFLVIGIDDLKDVVQGYGRSAGDTALKTLAAASLGVLRRIDGFGRLEDEKFAALLPETDTTGAIILAERLRETISNMGIAVGRDSLEISISIGVAYRHEESTTVEAILEKAEEALDAAKRQGQNRVAVTTWEELGAMDKQIAAS